MEQLKEKAKRLCCLHNSLTHQVKMAHEIAEGIATELKEHKGHQVNYDEHDEGFEEPSDVYGLIDELNSDWDLDDDYIAMMLGGGEADSFAADVKEFGQLLAEITSEIN